MRNPKSEIRNPKQIRNPKTETGGRMSRSVLECGSPLPLLERDLNRPLSDSARGLAQSKTWRLVAAVVRRRLTCLGGTSSASPTFPESGPRGTRPSRISRALTSAATGLWLVLWILGFNAQLSSGFAQYSIDWWTVDGGGGTSTGGVYSVSGTLGQPDAGVMSGGSFTLTGGFWALPGLVQTPGAPTLYITNAAPGWATLWWVPPTPGFVLQENLSLSTTNWVYSLSGATNPVVVPAILPAKFYRLHKP